MGQDAGQQAPGFFIQPSPEDATPQDADEADQSIAMGDGEDARADQRGRQEAELSAQDGEQEPAKREFLKHGRKDHVFDQTYRRQGGRGPDEICVEPFGPVTRQMERLRQAIHHPLAPQTGCHHRQYHSHQTTDTGPSDFQSKSFIKRHAGRPEEMMVGQEE